MKKIITLSEIKIDPEFRKSIPKTGKVCARMKELRKYGKFITPIVIDENNILRDGYTTYILAKGFDFNEIEVIVREEYNDRVPIAIWEKATDEYMYWYQCSACKEKVPIGSFHQDLFYNFCPNCGAKMVKEEAITDNE